MVKLGLQEGLLFTPATFQLSKILLLSFTAAGGEEELLNLSSAKAVDDIINKIMRINLIITSCFSILKFNFGILIPPIQIASPCSISHPSCGASIMISISP